MKQNQIKTQPVILTPATAQQTTAPMLIVRLRLIQAVTPTYTAILDPSEYKFYASQIPDFNFWYPQNFYNHVSYSTEPYETSMGTNEETIIFTAEDTSQLRFLAIRRTDSLALDTMAKTIYTSELGLLTSSEVIFNDVKDHSGKIIVTGWDKQYPDNTVYSLTRVTNGLYPANESSFPVLYSGRG